MQILYGMARNFGRLLKLRPLEDFTVAVGQAFSIVYHLPKLWCRFEI